MSRVAQPTSRRTARRERASSMRLVKGRRAEQAGSAAVGSLSSTRLNGSEQVLALQQTLGNQAVQRLLASQTGAPAQKSRLSMGAIKRVPTFEPVQRKGPDPDPSKEAETKVAIPTVIGYIGMNPAAAKEANVLKQVSKDKVLISLDDPAAQKSMSTDEGLGVFIYKELGLNPVTDLGKFIEAFTVLKAIQKNAREQIGHMMKWFAGAEQGKHTLQRIVLSGHSDGVDLWGDSEADHEPGSFMIHRDLANIAKVYPKAAGQVQDIMFSACWSVMAIQKMVEIFPNVKTVWGYIGFSPSIKKGSAKHIQKWEMTTRGENTPRARDRRGDAAIWTKADGYIAGSPGDYDLQELKDEVNATGPQAGEMYNGGKPLDGDFLRDYYFNLQLISIHPEAKPDMVKSARDQLEIVLRLRYYSVIVGKFREMHAETMKKGYAGAGMAYPTYAIYRNRDQLKAHMADIESQLAKKPNGDLREFLDKQLRKGLWELDTQVIPDEWI